MLLDSRYCIFTCMSHFSLFNFLNSASASQKPTQIDLGKQHTFQGECSPSQESGVFRGKIGNTHSREMQAISRGRYNNPFVLGYKYLQSTVARGWTKGRVREELHNFSPVLPALAIACTMLIFAGKDVDQRYGPRTGAGLLKECFFCISKVQGYFLHSSGSGAVLLRLSTSFFFLCPQIPVSVTMVPFDFNEKLSLLIVTLCQK